MSKGGWGFVKCDMLMFIAFYDAIVTIRINMQLIQFIQSIKTIKTTNPMLFLL